MDHAELVTFVSRLHRWAIENGLVAVAIMCEEFGERLYVEANGAKIETALTALAEDAGVDAPECPVCARRAVAHLAAQKRWREKRRNGKKPRRAKND